MLTGHIRLASIRQLPSQLVAILVVLGLLTIDGTLQRCFHEAQMTQPTTKRVIRPQNQLPHPNLAVVCDAEQVIYSKFDRKGDSKITYTAGAIENAEINLHTVNVLEGTKRAFNNRRSKYQ
jgi:hypothetical protein